MSDKPKIQSHLSLRLASIPSTLPLPLALDFINAFWITIMREWHGIDRLRLDKYYLLLKNFQKSTFELVQKAHDQGEPVHTLFLEMMMQGPLR